VHAVLDFGPHGGSHGHRDKLALYFYGDTDAWQPDPGQVPYGHRELRAYYASTAAHPAFSVDGREQQECVGRLVASGPDTVTAAADDCYPGVTARRTITAGPGYLLDLLHLTADEARSLAVHLRPDCPLTATLTADGVLHTEWPGDRVLHGTHVCTEPSIPLATPGRGPADRPDQPRTHVDWTVRGEGAVFCSVYHLEPDVSVRLAGSHLLVTAAGETHQHSLAAPC
jgi:hypothetical protein